MSCDLHLHRVRGRHRPERKPESQWQSLPPSPVLQPLVTTTPLSTDLQRLSLYPRIPHSRKGFFKTYRLLRERETERERGKSREGGFSQVQGAPTAMVSHGNDSWRGALGSSQVFGILGLASLGPNLGVSEVRGRVCSLFRIQAYVSLGFCARCIASGGAAWDSVSPTSPTFPVSFSAETPWCGGCVG